MKRKSPIQQLVHSSRAARSKIARAIRWSVVDIKRSVDMFPLKRIRLRSHAASEFEGERIDACSRAARACWFSPNFRLEKIDFCLVSCTATGGPPQALVPVSALPDHGLGLLHFSL